MIDFFFNLAIFWSGFVVGHWVDGLVIDFQNWQSRESDNE